jgi:hypothetical protein
MVRGGTRGGGGGPVPAANERALWRRPSIGEAGDPAHDTAGRSGGGTWATVAVGSAHKNSNVFDLFKGISERSDLIRLKDGLSKLKFF